MLKIKLHAEGANKHKSRSIDSEGAHFSQSYNPRKRRHDGSNNYKNAKKPYNCGYCQKPGHKESECHKKAYDEREKSQKAAIADDKNQEDESDEEAWLITTEDTTEMALSTHDSRSEDWFLDSGATSHMCGDRTPLSNTRAVTNSKVSMANGGVTTITEKGTASIFVSNKNIKLENTLRVPNLRGNLISVARITDNRRTVIFEQSGFTIKDEHGRKIISGLRSGNLYKIKTQTEVAAIAREKNDITEWHQKFGHLNETDLRKLFSRGLVTGPKVDFKHGLPQCDICIVSKQCAASFIGSPEISAEVLGRIHSDVCGAMRKKSIGGASYLATFIDDYSRWIEPHFLKTKDEVKPAFIKFKNLAENKLGKKVKILRTDGGLEYTGEEFQLELDNGGITREVTTPHTPQLNGVAERMNRTLVEMARCMLTSSGLPEYLWAEAINTAAYIRNRSPTSTFNTTPYERWEGRKPSVSHFKIFGQVAYALEKAPGKGKFEPRSTKCHFVGYSSSSQTYRLWNL